MYNLKIKKIMSLLETLDFNEMNQLIESLQIDINDDLLEVIAKRIDYDGDLEALKKGINIELEHADTVNWNLLTMASIAKDHLEEFSDYYEKLEEIEKS